MCALLLASGVSQAATHEPLRILSYELFAPRAETAVGQQKIGGTTSTRFKFDAFGRHFGLTLEKNTSLAAWVEAKSPTLSVYRGTLDNVPGSWARMSAKGQQIRGMIWDGHDLFIVDAAAAAETDANTSKDQTIIYRLADTQIEPGVAFCGTEAVSGKAAYSALVDELKGSPVLMQAAGASLRLEISALADSLLRTRYSDDEETRDEILARLNNVDGIFSSQIGVEIQIPSFDIDDETTQQLSPSTNPNTLVKNLASVRSKTPALRSRGLSHLFTGRDLDGTTVGIAFTDSLCSTQWGVGLTQMGRSVGIDSLITAHEIGHNFGAVHDGDKQCSGTPLNQFIMSPTVSPNATTFSSCSLDAILPRKRTASCLAVLPPPDLSLSSNVDNKSATIHQPVDWTVTVANIGGSGAQAARLVVNAPAAVIIKDVSLDSSQCSQSGGSLTCELGDIAARGLREIRGVLEGTAAGTYTLTAQVTASNESSMSNNKVQGTLTITPEVDVAVSLTAPDSAVVGTGVTLTFSVQNMTSTEAKALDIQLSVPAALTVASAQIGSTACPLLNGVVHCQVDSLAAGASVSGTVLATATTAGSASVNASISSPDFDPNAANNQVERTITISPPQPVVQATAAAQKKSGGGGSLPWQLLVSLAAILRLRTQKPRS